MLRDATRPQIRQGDVLLTPIEPPYEAHRVYDDDGRPLGGLVVEGERTGHAHRLEAEVYDAEGGRVLRVESPRPITHEEHGPITVPPGYWRVSLQREHIAQSSTRRWD